MYGILHRKIGAILQSLSSKIDFYIKKPLKKALSHDKICSIRKKAVSLHAFSRRAYAGIMRESAKTIVNKQNY